MGSSNVITDISTFVIPGGYSENVLSEEPENFIKEKLLNPIDEILCGETILWHEF